LCGEAAAGARSTNPRVARNFCYCSGVRVCDAGARDATGRDRVDEPRCAALNLPVQTGRGPQRVHWR